MTGTMSHPHWCGGGHLCTAGTAPGEHRSHPLSVDTDAGRIVATRVQHARNGRGRLELRIVVYLPADAGQAARAARAVMQRLGHALTSPGGVR